MRYFALAASLIILLAACGTASRPSPTPDLKATETTGALAPTATFTSTSAVTPADTVTPLLTDTAALALTDTPTPAPEAAPTDTPAPIVTPTAPLASPTPTTYTVQAGDNLSKIAAHLGLPVTALAAYNNISDPSKIYVGQILQIPPADYVAPAEAVVAWTATAQAVPTVTPLPAVVVDTPTMAPTAAVADTPTSVPTVAPPPATPQPTARVCCRICTTGKACGDSCISRRYTCHKPPGCACNAY